MLLIRDIPSDPSGVPAVGEKHDFAIGCGEKAKCVQPDLRVIGLIAP